MKNQGKPGIVREFSIILMEVREKSGKANYLVLISFSLTHAWLLANWLFYLFSANLNFNTLHSAI